MKYFFKSSAFAAACILTAPAFAQQTAFTYQGRLNDSGAAANGTYDLQFTIYDSTYSPGTIIAGPITNTATGVTNGLFTVQLDFGAAPFNGAPRWLNIGARTNGSASPFATLAPRQPLTPTPYAIFAAGANAAGISGTITSNLLAPGSVGPAQLASNVGVWTQSGSNISYNSGFVGIGTTNPQEPLQIVGGSNSPIRDLEVSADSNAPYGSFFGLDASATTGGQEYLIFSTGGAAGEGQGKLVFKDQSSGVYGLTIQSNGFVGIDTPSPSAPLHVVTANENIATFQSSFNEASVSFDNSSSGGNNWQILSVNGANSFQPGGLLFAAGLNTALVLAPSGNVGIAGTAQPGFPLTVGAAYCDGSTWHNASDRALKENFSCVDPLDVLEKVVTLPISEWNYKKEKDAKHLGPVAQDFHASFHLGGSDDKSISTVDEGGVALAAVQGLNEKLTQELARRDKENAELKRQLEEIKESLRKLTGEKAGQQ